VASTSLDDGDDGEQAEPEEEEEEDRKLGRLLMVGAGHRNDPMDYLGSSIHLPFLLEEAIAAGFEEWKPPFGLACMSGLLEYLRNP